MVPDPCLTTHCFVAQTLLLDLQHITSSRMYRLIIILSLITTLLQEGDAYSSGASPEACSTLQPNHDGASSRPVETNSFELTIEQFLAPSGVYQYVPGVTYTGNIYVAFCK